MSTNNEQVITKTQLVEMYRAGKMDNEQLRRLIIRREKKFYTPRWYVFQFISSLLTAFLILLGIGSVKKPI